MKYVVLFVLALFVVGCSDLGTEASDELGPILLITDDGTWNSGEVFQDGLNWGCYVRYKNVGDAVAPNVRVTFFLGYADTTVTLEGEDLWPGEEDMIQWRRDQPIDTCVVSVSTSWQ